MIPEDRTPISKKSATRFFNWRQYFRDMYVSGVRAVTGSVLAFSGTNTAESVAPRALEDVGLDWKQAVAGTLCVLLFDLMRYINLHPLPPEEITEIHENHQTPVG